MDVCGRIQAHIDRNCNVPITGLDDEVVFINHADIDFPECEFSPTNPYLMTALALKDGKQGYLLKGINMSNEGEDTLSPRPYINGWDHSLVFRIFENTPDVKQWVNEAANARFIAITKNKEKNLKATTGTDVGNTIYEVKGFHVGLTLTEASRNAQDEDSHGGWVLTAATGDQKEPYAPYSLFVTNLATTEALVESLYADPAH